MIGQQLETYRPSRSLEDEVRAIQRACINVQQQSVIAGARRHLVAITARIDDVIISATVQRGYC